MCRNARELTSPWQILSLPPMDPETVRRANLPFGSAEVHWRGQLVTRVMLRSRLCTSSDATLARQLLSVLRGGRVPEALLVDSGVLTSFVRRVLGQCVRIRPGMVLTYGELARNAGSPGAARAVGQVMARNPFPILFPCHRVVATGLRLGGFAGGVTMKRKMLETEGWVVGAGGRLTR